MNSFIDGLTGAYHKTVEGIKNNVDPTYAKKQKEVRDATQAGSLAAVALLVADVAFFVLGFALCAAGGGALVLGIPLVLVTLPVGYLAYNAYRTCENLKEIIDTPSKYQNLGGIGGWHKDSFKTGLIKGTFCFEWFADLIVQNMVEKGLAQ